MLSGIVKLADINDFIMPNQECVKNILNNNKKNVTKINLFDCLACNGCLTSSETILIKEHSLQKHFDFLQKEKKKISIACISNQSLESLNFYFKIDYKNILKIICKILKIDFIFTLEDFIYFTLNLVYDEINNNKLILFCSECPGWTFYAQKKIGKNIINHLSKIKSPQQIFSIIIREKIKNFVNNCFDDVYICSIASCFDKKIESIQNKNEINCVLSTIELVDKIKDEIENFDFNFEFKNYFTFENFENLLEKFKINNNNNNNIENLIKYLIENNNNSTFYSPIYLFKNNYSSNNYIEFMIYKITSENKNFYIERKKGKNKDINEILIYDSEKKENLIKKFCIAYGFRNIQKLVNDFKNNKLNYDFIEIMACPGGCINGGGQIRENNQNRELLNYVNSKFDEKKIFDFNNKNNNILFNFIYKNNFDKNIFYQKFKEIEFSMSDLQW